MTTPSIEDYNNTPGTVKEYVKHLEALVQHQSTAFYHSLRARNNYIKAIQAENTAFMKTLFEGVE
jgi:hypothetical protein